MMPHLVLDRFVANKKGCEKCADEVQEFREQMVEALRTIEHTTIDRCAKVVEYVAVPGNPCCDALLESARAIRALKEMTDE